jgi:hypothetical protein
MKWNYHLEALELSCTSKIVSMKIQSWLDFISLLLSVLIPPRLGIRPYPDLYDLFYRIFAIKLRYETIKASVKEYGLDFKAEITKEVVNKEWFDSILQCYEKVLIEEKSRMASFEKLMNTLTPIERKEREDYIKSQPPSYDPETGSIDLYDFHLCMRLPVKSKNSSKNTLFQPIVDLFDDWNVINMSLGSIYNKNLISKHDPKRAEGFDEEYFWVMLGVDPPPAKK